MIGAAALTGVAYAGPAPVEVKEASVAESHTCDALKSIGKLYKNKSNPFIQEVKFFGRAHYQYGYVDGSEAPSEGYSEWRRVRMGSQIKFGQYFSVMVRANLENGGANNHSFEFGGYDETKIGFDIAKAFDNSYFDEASFTFGRHKINMGEDVHVSSKKIKTVERTALTGKIRPDNSTGGAFNLKKGDWEGSFGVFTAAEGDTEALFDDFGSEKYIYVSSTFGLESGDLIFDFILNPDADEADSDYTNNWAASVAYRTEIKDWDFAANVVLGDTESSNTDREGLFYGLVLQPSKFIIEDKLEFVGRYYFQASDGSEGIRANSRYSRDGLGNSGRGDFHQSVYAGLNYYLCGHNAKLMVGVEYETLDTPADDANATTLWSAFRFYF